MDTSGTFPEIFLFIISKTKQYTLMVFTAKVKIRAPTKLQKSLNA